MFFKMSLIGFLQMLSALARMRCTLWSLACYYAGEPGSKSLQAPGIKKKHTGRCGGNKRRQGKVSQTGFVSCSRPTPGGVAAWALGTFGCWPWPNQLSAGL